MNVLHIVITDKFSGAEKVASLICQNLNSKINSHIICGGETLKQYYRKQGLNSNCINFNNNILKVIKDLNKYIKENNIHIVHAHDNKASIYALLSKIVYKNNIKLVSHIHSCYPWLKKGIIYKFIDRIVRNKYDLNIMCGKFVYEYYRSNTNYMDFSKVVNISNFIDITNIIDLAKKYKREENKILTFGFVGRLSDEKGIVEFMNNLVKYKQSFSNTKFVIVGSGEKEELLHQIVKNNGMEWLIELKGYQNNPYKYYSMFDVLFLPSKYEGLPMVILEAMTLNIPVVSMNVGGISEVINKDNGILVEAGNYDSFLKELLNLKNNPSKIESMGKNSLSFIKSNYDAEEVTKELEKLYIKICAS